MDEEATSECENNQFQRRRSSRIKSSNTSSIDLLPENILLEILSYLPVKDRCIAGRVCRKWCRIVRDNSLWRHVDLLDYRLDLRKMWKVLKAHFSPCLLSMQILGYAHTVGRKRKKASVSDAMLKELATRCPNLQLLHLKDCNTDNISFQSIPQSLETLQITISTWQPRWLKGHSTHLPNLQHLDLSCSSRVDNFDLEDIAKLSTLKTLNLSGCYRIKGSAFEVAARGLKQLTYLNLNSTSIDELTVHHISRHMKNLEELHVANCVAAVNDSSVACLSTGLAKLIVLDMTGCHDVTIDGAKSLWRMNHLTKIIMKRRCRQFLDSEIDDLNCGFAGTVEIIYKD